VNLTGRFNYRFGVTQLILAAESAAGLYYILWLSAAAAAIVKDTRFPSLVAAHTPAHAAAQRNNDQIIIII